MIKVGDTVKILRTESHIGPKRLTIGNITKVTWAAGDLVETDNGWVYQASNLELVTDDIWFEMD